MASNNDLPKWSTPDRRQHLIDLFTRSGGFCVFGHKPCLVPSHHYELFIDDLIADWKATDRIDREADWKAQLKALHSLAERKYPLRGQFSAVSRDIWQANKPQFYIHDLGINGLTFEPFASVRLSSTYMRLYIGLGDTLRGVSKNKKRKAVRYGNPLPLTIERAIRGIVREAVKHYLDH